MPASMAAASGDGNGPAVCADPLLVGGATYALTGRSTSCHQRRVACWRRRRGDRALPTSRSWAAACRRSISALGQHSGQSGMLVVHLALRPMSAFGLDDRAKVSALTSGADPRSPAPTTLSSLAAQLALRHASAS